MEDTVSIYPSFLQDKHEKSSILHFFGLYDGHGCSHVINLNINLLGLLLMYAISSFFANFVEWLLM